MSAKLPKIDSTGLRGAKRAGAESVSSVTRIGTESDPETLAEAIVKVSEGFERLKKSGLNHKAIVVLLHDLTGVGKRDIETILTGLGELAKRYTSK